MEPVKLTEVVAKDEKVVVSKAWSKPIWEDYKAWGMNAIKYSSPVILMVLVSIQAGKTWDEIKLAVYGILLQNAINIFSKFASEQRYVVQK